MEERGNAKKIKEYFNGENQPGEESWINDFFCDDSRKMELKDSMSEQFDEMMEGEKEESNELDHVLYRIHYYINSISHKKKERITLLHRVLRIAGVIIIPILVYWGVKGNRNYALADSATAEIHAPAWTRASFSLPDGTTGWLNSNSSIEYNVNFIKERHVKLNGEAFFDVAHDKNKMFIVDAGEITIKVHGTKFNVSSYEEENNVEIVLEEGRIELVGKSSESSLILAPDELAVFDKSSHKFSTGMVETRKYISWTEGKLVFRNDPMEIVARRLERWYNVDVELDGFFDDNLRLRATFVDENLTEVLDILKRSLEIDYKIEDPVMNPTGVYGKRKVKIYVSKK